MPNIEKNKLRDLPGWEKNAPVPVCLGGDCRALTFCCKPGYSLNFGYKCKREEILSEVGISGKEFIKIKEDFSKDNDWDSDVVCFGSISYCCMRRGGCPSRDVALVDRYPGLPIEEIMEIYFQKKKELSKKILESIRNQEGKDKIKPYLDLF
jgi:predicted metal-binding transcription factor (methanogenesis marker protein 9)